MKRIATMLMGLACGLWTSSAFALIETATITGSTQPVDCNPLSGADEDTALLYRQPNERFLCIQMWNDTLIMKGENTAYGPLFDVRLQRDREVKNRYTGTAVVRGWGYIWSPVSNTRDLVACPFQMPVVAEVSPKGDILLSKPVVQYDTTSCAMFSRDHQWEVYVPATSLED